MKMSRACPGILSSENDDEHVHNCSQSAVLYIFRNIEITILVTFH